MLLSEALLFWLMPLVAYTSLYPFAKGTYATLLKLSVSMSVATKITINALWQSRVLYLVTMHGWISAPFTHPVTAVALIMCKTRDCILSCLASLITLETSSFLACCKDDTKALSEELASQSLYT